MPNTYTPQTWTDGAGGGTPISAARLAVLETAMQGAWARELAYTQFTSNVSLTATTAATANTVVTASAVTFDGSTAAIISFVATRADAPAGTVLNIELYQDGSAIGTMANVTPASTIAIGAPIHGARRMTPASGSRTYSIRGWMSSGTGTVYAGVGGSGVVLPGFIRIERA